jgi:hypothetical protein
MLLSRVGILSLALAAMLFSAEVVSAQGTSVRPTKPTAPTAAKKFKALDLPLEAPAGGLERGEIQYPEPEPEPPGEEEPPEFYGEPIPTEGSTIFYVCDESCSMAWDQRPYVDDEGNTRSGYRMDRAKSELRKAIRQLPKSFRFNLIGYGCSIKRFRNGLVEADAGNKGSALTWINSMNPGGGTMTGPAVAQALAVKENKSVVLLTDGAPNCGASGFAGHKTVIKSNNTQSAIITVFGIGAYGSLKAFCQQIARDNGGNYIDVP